MSLNMSPPEVWLRGPVEGIPRWLQPVAHGLLQCREELHLHVEGLSAEQIWGRPAGVTPIGFHLRHAARSVDRLFTYARGEQLSDSQREALASEGVEDLTPDIGARLLEEFDASVDRALVQLHGTSETALLEARGVGRAQAPSTVLGLLFHAAEHAQRHIGQVVTTVKFITRVSESAGER